eukprot:TRINITY_DN11532_c0_g3_i1.p1 TRINITY_DN11532_c0_g3~~TRINITY_DN11532_c0_g3_i1.p1  ORF type:complete len:600 (-),score=34.28 TRINITY_DN11532_c0_g3_i1:214-1968(-)
MHGTALEASIQGAHQSILGMMTDSSLELKAELEKTYRDGFMDVMLVPGGSAEAVLELYDRCHVDAFVEAMLRVRAAAVAKRRLLGVVGPGATKAEQYTVRDMLSFQQDSIPSPILRLSAALHDPALRVFADCLRFMGLSDGRELARGEEVALVVRLLGEIAREPALRDEVCMQLWKQTRGNEYKGSLLKAWELMRVCAGAYPPTTTVAGPLSEYFSALVADQSQDATCREAVLAAWKALDHGLKNGPRRCVPTEEEVVCMLNRTPMLVPVYLCDDTLENVPVTPTSTVAEAMQMVLRKLNILDTSSFAMFTCRILKPVGATPSDPTVDHVPLDPSTYVCDVIADFVRASKGSMVVCKLLIKKRFFAPTDAAVAEPQHVRLCYAQLRYDYMTNHYLVTVEGAVVLAALQIAAEIGVIANPETALEWSIQMKRSIPKIVSRLKSKDEWMNLILEPYRTLWSLDHEGTMREFVRILLEIPQGGSVFFDLKTLVDSAAYFPKLVVVGVNHNGLHFLDDDLRSVIHVAELKEIAEYDGKPDRVFFQMTLNDELHSFEFATAGGDEICFLLDMHIADALRAPQAQAKAQT